MQWNVYGEFPESRTERDHPSSKSFQAIDHTETNKALHNKAKVIVMGTGMWSITNMQDCPSTGSKPAFYGLDPLTEMVKFVDDHKRRTGEKVTSGCIRSPMF